MATSCRFDSHRPNQPPSNSTALASSNTDAPIARWVLPLFPEPYLDPPVLLPSLRIVGAVRPLVRRDRSIHAPPPGLDRRRCHHLPIDEPALDSFRTLHRQMDIVGCVADCIGVALDDERARRSLP